MDRLQLPHAGEQRVAVELAREIARLDRGRLGRVRRLDAHVAAALGTQLAHRDDEARERVQGGACRVGAEDEEVQLHIGRCEVGTGAQERARIAGADREHALAGREVAQAGEHPVAPVVHHVVHGDRLCAAILEAHLQMVLQVGADAGDVGRDRDAVLPQQRGRAEAGELHELRRVEGAAGEDHLAIGARHMRRAAAAILDAGRTAAVEQDAGRERVGDDLEVGAPARLAQIAGRGRAAQPVARGVLEVAGAFLGGAVEVVVARMARLLHGRDERLAQRMRLAHVGHGERPADPVQRVGAALLVLGAAEIGEHVVVAPARIAELAPAVEVLVLAADIEKPVDRARAAQHLAARLDDAAVVELGLGLRRIEPVDAGIVEQLAVAERHVDPEMQVVPAGLEQQHAVAAVGREAIGQHAAGTAGADDNVIEGLRPYLVRHGVSPAYPRLHH